MFISTTLPVHPNSAQYEKEEAGCVCGTSTVFLDREGHVSFFIFVLYRSEKRGRQKIPVSIEEILFPPTFRVKELTCVELSILKQQHNRMSLDPCSWLMSIFST